MDDSRFISPECKDTGIVYYNGENGYLYARPCKCRAVKEAKMRIERSGLAKLFKSKTFDSFKTYSDPILEDAKRTVMRFAETFESHGEEEANSLLLCGQVGAGKTHLGAACSMQLMDRGIPVVYMGYRDEMTSLKSKIIDEKAYSDTVNRFKTAKVLFIDDFIKGKTTESDVNIVYEIVNYRYNNHLPMIVSTEKPLEDLIVFDEAIGSRLIEMCRGYIVVFEGKKLNYRLYKGAL